MDTSAYFSSDSAIQSPDSAIGGTPTLTPDQESPEPPQENLKLQPTQKAEASESVKIELNPTILESELPKEKEEENQNRPSPSITVTDETLQDVEQQQVSIKTS